MTARLVVIQLMTANPLAKHYADMAAHPADAVVNILGVMPVGCGMTGINMAMRTGLPVAPMMAAHMLQ